MKTYEEVAYLYNAYELALKSPKPEGQFLEEGTVINPKQTVEWNVQMVKLQNEAYTKAIHERLTMCNRAKYEYQHALDEFLLTDPEYGNGKLTETQLKKVKSFMYDWCEDTAIYNDGFGNYMCLARDLIGLIVQEA